MAPLARFVEAAGHLRASWHDAKAYFSENLNRHTGNPDQLDKLESAEELLDDAVANAEAVLKGFAKLCQHAKPSTDPGAEPESVRLKGLVKQEIKPESNAKRIKREIYVKQAEPNQRLMPLPTAAPTQKRNHESAVRCSEEEPPWRQGALLGKRRNENADHGLPRSRQEWTAFRFAERQAKRLANPTPNQICRKELFDSVLPERLASLPQARLLDLLQGAIERWLKHGSKKRNKGVPDVETGALDLLWNSAKFKAIFPLISPPIESLAEWISENMDEITVYEDEDGKTMLSRKSVNQESHEYQERYQEAVDAFLDTLPEDHLTEEEEALREALMTFLRAWWCDSPPLIYQTYSLEHETGLEVALSMWALLPRPVKLRDWILNRIGGEIGLLEQKPGEWAVHLVS